MHKMASSLTSFGISVVTTTILLTALKLKSNKVASLALLVNMAIQTTAFATNWQSYGSALLGTVAIVYPFLYLESTRV